MRSAPSTTRTRPKSTTCFLPTLPFAQIYYTISDGLMSTFCQSKGVQLPRAKTLKPLGDVLDPESDSSMPGSRALSPWSCTTPAVVFGITTSGVRYYWSGVSVVCLSCQLSVCVNNSLDKRDNHTHLDIPAPKAVHIKPRRVNR